jgi:ankyrin repeat protein
LRKKIGDFANQFLEMASAETTLTMDVATAMMESVRNRDIDALEQCIKDVDPREIAQLLQGGVFGEFSETFAQVFVPTFPARVAAYDRRKNDELSPQVDLSPQEKTPLLVAIASGQVQECLALIKNDENDENDDEKEKLLAQVNAIIENGLSPLHASMKKGGAMHEVSMTLIECARCDLNATSRGGQTLFSLACRLNRVECAVEIARSERFSAGYDGARKVSALMSAAAAGVAPAVEALLGRGIDSLDVNAVDGVELTALGLACNGGYVDIVRLLVECDDAAVDLNGGRVCPITLACSKRSAACVDVLLEHVESDRVNVNHVDAVGLTPLMHAVDSGVIPLVERLLAVPGIDVNAAGDNGISALMVALRISVDMLEALLAHPDVDPNRAMADGATPLIGLITANPTPELASVAEALLKCPRVDVNAAVQGKRPLEWALAAQRIDLATCIVARPDFEFFLDPEGSGATMLMVAAAIGNVDFLRAMLSDKDPDALQLNALVNNQSALFFACLGRHAAAVDILVRQPGIDINAGLSPLRAAIMVNDADSLRRLLAEPPLDVNCSDNDDCEAPLVLAISHCSDENTSLLLARADLNVDDALSRGSRDYVRRYEADAEQDAVITHFFGEATQSLLNNFFSLFF